jgi:hypothetical protein
MVFQMGQLMISVEFTKIGFYASMAEYPMLYAVANFETSQPVPILGQWPIIIFELILTESFQYFGYGNLELTPVY